MFKTSCEFIHCYITGILNVHIHAKQILFLVGRTLDSLYFLINYLKNKIELKPILRLKYFEKEIEG